MAAVGHSFQYLSESRVESTSGRQAVRLATSGGTSQGRPSATHPYFFQGALTEPRVTAVALNTLAQVVSARFTMTPQELAAMKDPVVTSGGGMLRFEGFSGCCGLYARVDLNPEAYDGLVVDQGTTNVDFNAPMRNALARIRANESVSLAVGDDEVTLLRGADQVVERKVKLPTRWLKGFVEVQAYQARMKPRFECDRVTAVRFLQSIPRLKGRTQFWVTAAGRTLRFSRTPAKESVQVASLERLRLLEPLIPLVKGLRIYAEDDGETSAWEVNLGVQRFTLAVSPDAYRGFSGEGQVLNDLVLDHAEDLLHQARASLKWQAELRAEEFSQNWNADTADVRGALALLGTRGLVGFDLNRDAHFHRELPFDLGKVESLHPRLKGARTLVNENKVAVLEHGAKWTANIAGTDITHRVSLQGDEGRCTCQWFTKYLGARGPCKHILALKITRDGDPGTED